VRNYVSPIEFELKFALDEFIGMAA